MAKSDIKLILETVQILERRFGSLERGYDRLRMDVDVLKQDMGGLKMEMNQLKNNLVTKMDSLAALFGGNDETISMLRVRTSRHEDDIRNIKRKVGIK